ncbi:hypothetical protein [Pontitalea aquivivens]|uniref:hypothetical protein n=1 Tax=Pontitalea aquivivens TaxID=3388663 RepID=UPI00397050D7
MSVLLIAEVNGGDLALDATAKALSAAKALGPVTVLVAGSGVDAAAAAAARSGSENCGNICAESLWWTRPNLARQSASVSTLRWSTTKSRNAISAGSLRVVMTPLRHSRLPQNGTGQASPEEANGLL